MLKAVAPFAGYFNRTVTPKVLLTTCYKPTKVMYQFLAEMLETLPSAYYYKRQVSVQSAMEHFMGIC